ncbi:lytic transglycosylase domain-containing protein [Actinotalea solisilvae]|uniref:lytic transglycosylase domain-containing protein n=1 Tax=Actinotalea solisilvae TaxID=2072922 RepID=UPI0018F1AA16|nr:lytic transglycosylase domain-containing protein [Actinotalea solisilvae]
MPNAASNAALRAPATRRRAASGTGVGLALAVVGVAATAAPAHAGDYVVAPGDTVSHIAQRTSTSVAAIVSANGLDARASITAGQRLVIPTAAAATPVPAAAPAPTSASHTVVRGDTVSGIATRYGTTTAAIVSANGLGANALIRIGQTLTVPTGGAATAAPAAPAPAAPAASSHTVVRGDTVSGIATRYGTTTAAIVSANGLGANALIRIGQTLTVPTGGAPTAAPAAAPAPAAPAAGSHTVVRGDTVSGIATRYGTTTAAIVSANGLGANALIRIGQTLSVPGAAPAATPTTALVGNTFAGRTYPEATVASANANKATLLAIGVPSKAEMQQLVISTAQAMGVDPALAQAVAYQESGFNQSAVSPANAIGTMQVIPSSGQWASDLVGRPLNLLDPRDNVTAGVAILRQLVATSPDLPTAIAGYYQGAAGVARYGMYPDTRRYVASVQTHMARYA